MISFYFWFYRNVKGIFDVVMDVLLAVLLDQCLLVVVLGTNIMRATLFKAPKQSPGIPTIAISS